MKGAGEVVQVKSQAVRFQCAGACLDDLGEPDHALDERYFLREREHRGVDVAVGRNRKSLLQGRPHDARYPGVGILHVIHGVFIRLPLRQVEVEIEMAVGPPHHEIVARRVPAHLVDDLPQGDELAGPRRHGHGLPLPEQAHELDKDDLQRLPLSPEGLDAGMDPWDVAVVIGAPDVDDEVEPAGVLVLMIGDVGGEVGGHVVLPHHHTVLLVAEGRRLEPGGVFRLVDEAPLFQILEEFRHSVVPVEFPLAEVDVEDDAEGPEIVPDAFHDRACRVVREEREDRLLASGVEITVALLLEDFPGELDDVIAPVTLLREIHLDALELKIAVIDRPPQVVHLLPHVVDVILPCHGIPRRPEDVGHHVPDHGAPGMPYMQGPGGVGAHELHHDLAAPAEAGAAVSLPQLFHFLQERRPDVLLQVEIDEARSCDLDLLKNSAPVIHVLQDALGDLPGVSLRPRSEDHGHIGRVVSVGLFPWRLQFDEGQIPRLQDTRGRAGFQ